MSGRITELPKFSISLTSLAILLFICSNLQKKSNYDRFKVQEMNTDPLLRVQEVRGMFRSCDMLTILPARFSQAYFLSNVGIHICHSHH